MVQYADDTTLMCSGFTVDEVAATLNTQLSLYSRAKLNLKKSTVMWFSVKASKRRQYISLYCCGRFIVVGDSPLYVVDGWKYLRLIFDKMAYCHH